MKYKIIHLFVKLTNLFQSKIVTTKVNKKIFFLFFIIAVIAIQLRTFTGFHWIIHDPMKHELYCLHFEYFFYFIFSLFCSQCSDLFSFVPDCSRLFSFVLVLHPTEFSPIFREFLEILLDLQKSVFVIFLFTVELRYSMAKLRFLI
jgi:hypothetical protein